MIYFFSIIIIFILLDLFIYDNNKKDKLFIILMIIFTFLSCFRSYKVGTDTGMFWTDYTRIINTSFHNLNLFRYELGFTIMCKVLGLISRNPQTIIIFSGLITNLVIAYFIKTNAKNKLSSGIFYFTTNYYFIFLCLMRQSLAICFIFLGYNFLKKNKKIMFFIMILLAFSFHRSAIIFIFLPLFKYIKVPKNLPIYTIVVSILMFIVAQPIFNSFVLIGDYDKYLTSSFIESSYISAGLYSLSSFLFFLFGFVIPSKEKILKEKDIDSNYNLLTWILAIGTVVSVSSIKISIINRIYLYFGAFTMIWISNNLELLEDKKNKFSWKFILYFSTLCYVLVITILGWYGIFPYSFY